MKKKKVNEVSISGFINRFLDDMQKETQDRFIKQAKKKDVPPRVTIRLTKIEKEIADLEKILKDL
jgi:DNA-binding HxlR family transcriptional regulator